MSNLRWLLVQNVLQVRCSSCRPTNGVRALTREGKRKQPVKLNAAQNLRKKHQMMHTLKLSINDFMSVKNSSIVYFFGSNAKYFAVFWNIVVIFLYIPSSTSNCSLAVFRNWCSLVKKSTHSLHTHIYITTV